MPSLIYIARRLPLLRVSLAACLLVTANAQASAQEAAGPSASPQNISIRVQRLDDSYIDAYLNLPEDDGKASILLVFQGSECTSVDPEGDRFPFSLPRNVVRLDIQKYGISPERQRNEAGHCPSDYLENNTIDGRVLDALTVLSHLRASAGWWDGRLFVAGASEGATIAAIVGSLAPETRGLILINGSIGRPFSEGWTEAVLAEITRQGGDAETLAAARREIGATWEKARETPTSETYEGASNTLRWWRSIIDLRPLNLLINFRHPILLVQSERDQMTPAASARAAAARLARENPNFTYLELPGLDHGFLDADGQPQYEQVLPRLDAELARQASLAQGRQDD